MASARSTATDARTFRNDDGAIFDLLGTFVGGVVNNGDNSWMAVSTSLHIAAVGDFNGDGRDDILWRDATGTITDWLSTPSGGFAVGSGDANTTVALDWHIAGTADFNGDGFTDILWRNDDGAIFDFLGAANGGVTNNGGNSWAGVTNEWHVAGIGDFNGDGRADILWRGTDGTITDWLGQGDGGFADNSAVASQPLSTDYQIVGVGDFNGDGRSDLLLQVDQTYLET